MAGTRNAVCWQLEFQLHVDKREAVQTSISGNSCRRLVPFRW